MPFHLLPAVHGSNNAASAPEQASKLDTHRRPLTRHATWTTAIRDTPAIWLPYHLSTIPAAHRWPEVNLHTTVPPPEHAATAPECAATLAQACFLASLPLPHPTSPPQHPHELRSSCGCLSSSLRHSMTTFPCRGACMSCNARAGVTLMFPSPPSPNNAAKIMVLTSMVAPLPLPAFSSLQRSTVSRRSPHCPMPLRAPARAAKLAQELFFDAAPPPLPLQHPTAPFPAIPTSPAPIWDHSALDLFPPRSPPAVLCPCCSSTRQCHHASPAPSAQVLPDAAPLIHHLTSPHRCVRGLL
ncbi:hypothetical protein HYPSUDRAFT_209811 [Hypholoma sublateritium FD-334 SS-4]|uniref:Uncharacterized protein n=1 Tax=Hypholoma sublateritium (strain FD-334 SS-4) TaxID=945553 RepID=A0A0D2N8V6_HYPSF|nr:hypothetical protein HYPSUDRAFT_209811 [Hypholoma sublateritium FD-334 SS-4]